MKNVAIKDWAVYLPGSPIPNSEIAKLVAEKDTTEKLDPKMLERLFGSKYRYYAKQEDQVSDLACKAAQIILDKPETPTVDLLIFAAASSDLIEPATANIIQNKLGILCPVMDIKNACNSFVTAMQTATAFIQAGMYQNVLIVNGEKLSEVINFGPENKEEMNRYFSGFSLGDAGAAMLLGTGEDKKLIYQKFQTWGEYWELCTVKGGGSLAFREPNQYYFESDSNALKRVFETKGKDFFMSCLNEIPWETQEIDCVITHQIAATTSSQIAKYTGIKENKFINTFSEFGNTAAATIPIAIQWAYDKGILSTGSKVMILGLAAGASLSVQLISW